MEFGDFDDFGQYNSPMYPDYDMSCFDECLQPVEQPPQEQDNGVLFFDDAKQAAPALKSQQHCITKNIQGWLLLPAKYATKIRTSNSNHAKKVPVMFFPCLDEELAQKFE